LKKSGASHLKVKMYLSEKITLKSKFQINKDNQDEWIIDEKQALKLLDKKDLTIDLRKKKFLFGAETLDSKTFKLIGLSQKCDFEKEIKLKNSDFVIIFRLREPIR